MTTEAEVARIAAGLTTAQRGALRAMPAWGLPAGHNMWFDVCYELDGEDVCNGEDMNAVIRLGLVHAGHREADKGVHLVAEDREVEARSPLDLTPLGILVRAHLASPESAE